MSARPPRPPLPSRAGFTLAEVLVTVLIAGIAMLMLLQTLNSAKLKSAETRNQKQAQELALLTLGQVDAGLFWEDIDSGMIGYYDQHPEYSYEVVLGDDSFLEDAYDDGSQRPFDNWAYREDQRRRREDYDEDEELAAQPYEKVRVKVVFPSFRPGSPNHVILERWIPWEQVYGPDAESESSSAGGPEEG